MNRKPGNLKVAFFGTPRLAQITLEKLINSPFKPKIVVTSPDKKAGRGQKLQPSQVKQTALKNNIEILQPTNLLDKNFEFELAVLVAYGKIIPKSILKIPKYGFINVHPSILPKFRGSSPIQSAILEGENEIGSTVIKLDEEVDHGPILAQKAIRANKSDTHQSLIEKLGELGTNLLIEALPKYISGSLKPKPQNHIKATFTEKIQKADGQIDINNPPDSVTFDRMIRAFYPWPTTWVRLQTTNYRLRTIKFLPENLIQPEGKKPMTVKEFLNGYPKVKNLIEKLYLT